MNKYNEHQSGFTLIELLIATTIMSVFLTIVSTMTIRIGRMYYKGILQTRTQEAVREISAEITGSVRFGSGGVAAGANYFCTGEARYTYVLGKQLTDITAEVSAGGDKVSHVLVRDSPSACTGPADLTSFDYASQRELVPPGARLVALSVTQVLGVYEVKVRLVFGDAVLLCSPSIVGDCISTSSVITAGLAPLKGDIRCRDGNNVSTEFCAVSELTTIVQNRLQ